jgi:hypothetical protein
MTLSICTIILQISDLNVLSEISEYFIPLKTKECLVIISNVVRTLVFTTKWVGLVSQNPHRPDPSQYKENGNRLAVLSFTASFQGGIHRYDFIHVFKNLAYWPTGEVTSNPDSSS